MLYYIHHVQCRVCDIMDINILNSREFLFNNTLKVLLFMCGCARVNK